MLLINKRVTINEYVHYSAHNFHCTNCRADFGDKASCQSAPYRYEQLWVTPIVTSESLEQ